MSAERNEKRADRPDTEHDRRRAEAVRVLERWRAQGFDMVTCYPSGYCCPANSRMLRTALPEKYRSFPVESEAALDAVMSAMAAGAAYSTREQAEDAEGGDGTNTHH